MYWTIGIGVVFHARGKLEDSVGKAIYVGNASVNRSGREAGSASGEEFVVIVGQKSGLGLLCNCDA
ncbi:MAG: hypothetical protein NVS1B11_18770 [Terriglobales bacterium]